MPINFPDSPTLNQTYTYNTRTWIWDGVKWNILSSTNSPWADTVYTVSYSSTPAFDMNNGLIQKIVLTGNVTSSTISNAVQGQRLTLMISQDGVGGRTFVWPTNIFGEMTIGSGANETSIQTFICHDGTNFISESLGTIV